MITHSKAFRLETLQEIIATILRTANVTGMCPVSAILVGDSGTAKSKLLMSYRGVGIHHTDSFSSKGLFQLMQQDTKGVLRFIVTPDLNPTLSRRPSTVEATVANMLTLTADGTCRVDDGREEKIAEHAPIGFLTAVTPEMYAKQARRWLALGLRRRIIPLFYTYSTETTEFLIQRVNEGHITSANFAEQSFSLNSRTYSPAIDTITSERIRAHVAQFALNLGKTQSKVKDKYEWKLRKVAPISPLVTLRTLAQAHAIGRKSGKVEQVDVDFIASFIGFTDPSQPRQI